MLCLRTPERSITRVDRRNEDRYHCLFTFLDKPHLHPTHMISSVISREQGNPFPSLFYTINIRILQLPTSYGLVIYIYPILVAHFVMGTTVTSWYIYVCTDFSFIISCSVSTRSDDRPCRAAAKMRCNWLCLWSPVTHTTCPVYKLRFQLYCRSRFQCTILNLTPHLFFSAPVIICDIGSIPADLVCSHFFECPNNYRLTTSLIPTMPSLLEAMIGSCAVYTVPAYLIMHTLNSF